MHIARRWIVAILCLVGVAILGIKVAFQAPIAINGCAISGVESGFPKFAAEIRNRSDKVATTVYVLVYSSGGSVIEYAFTGRFLPGVSSHQQIVKDIRSEPFNDQQVSGSITRCQVHAVIYEDGSHWNGGSPM